MTRGIAATQQVCYLSAPRFATDHSASRVQGEPSMKVCVVGAGSIGGFVGAKLALAGEDVTLVARGANLEAIRARGMRVIMRDGAEQVAPGSRPRRRRPRPAPQDVVILGHEGPPGGAGREGPAPRCCHDDTVVVPMQNGIPWWYFQRHGGEFEGRRIEQRRSRRDDRRRDRSAADHRLRRLSGLRARRAGRRAPHRRRPLPARRARRTSSRAREARSPKPSCDAGLKAPMLDNIRAEIWLKLWGNLTFNPISALTHSTLVDICQFPPTRELAAAMMREAQPWRTSSASASACRSTSASPAPSRSASTRRRCCRTWRPGAIRRSTRWSVR